MGGGAIRAALEEGLGAVTAPGLARRAGVGAGAARDALAAFAEGPAGAGRGRVWLLGGWTKEGGAGAGAGGEAPSRHVLTLCHDADMKTREGGLERVTVKQLYALSPGEGVSADAGALWRADAEHLRDLHAEPADLKNCLRDNRHSTIAAPPGVTRAKVAGEGGVGGAKPAGKPLQNLQSSAGPPTSPPVPAGQPPRKAVEKAAPKMEPRGGESGMAKPAVVGKTANQAKGAAGGGPVDSAEASGGNLASMFSKASPKAEHPAPEKKKRQARHIVEDESEDEDEDDNSEEARGGDAGPPEEEEESPTKKARVEAPEASAPVVVGAPELNKRKEERTAINDKGEEVTEVVWVDKAGNPCSPPPKGPPPGANPARASLPEKPAVQFPKSSPAAPDRKPGKQKGIASFFGRK